MLQLAIAVSPFRCMVFARFSTSTATGYRPASPQPACLPAFSCWHAAIQLAPIRHAPFPNNSKLAPSNRVAGQQLELVIVIPVKVPFFSVAFLFISVLKRETSNLLLRSFVPLAHFSHTGQSCRRMETKRCRQREQKFSRRQHYSCIHIKPLRTTQYSYDCAEHLGAKGGDMELLSHLDQSMLWFLSCHSVIAPPVCNLKLVACWRFSCLGWEVLCVLLVDLEFLSVMR